VLGFVGYLLAAIQFHLEFNGFFLLVSVAGAALLADVLQRALGPAKREGKYLAQMAKWRRIWICLSCGHTWMK
jgi:hypothetical protein